MLVQSLVTSQAHLSDKGLRPAAYIAPSPWGAPNALGVTKLGIQIMVVLHPRLSGGASAGVQERARPMGIASAVRAQDHAFAPPLSSRKLSV